MTLFFIILAVVAISIMVYLKIFGSKKEGKSSEPIKLAEDPEEETKLYIEKEEKPSVDLDEFDEDNNESKIPPASLTSPPPDFPEI